MNARKRPRIARLAPAVVAVSLLVAALVSHTACGDRAGRGEILVFAAASLRDALRVIGDRFEEETGRHVAFNFAGSNVLARQIEASGRADVFLSADPQWVDHVHEKGRLAPGSRRVVLSNRLALVVHRDRRLALGSIADLPRASFDFLSIGDPEAVPAGRYAREALLAIPHEGSTVWDAVKDRVAPASDVRAALALVASDPDIVGIVYRSDAAVSDRVRVVAEITGDTAPVIRYVAARTEGARDAAAAERFLDFLLTPVAGQVFERYGFVPLHPSPAAPSEP